jgi:asparagine synthase (glutamine-hydrolysing)
MCGIAGFLLREGVADPALAQAMCDQIRHRGPDDEGIRVEAGCALGMRRLSIIDLSTGHQPMSNEDRSVWVVFNGEIYNYQGLRKELIAQGHRFETSSDTETLVHLYEQHGVEGLRRLRGMFAFAIWDSNRRRLLLARDRFGKKPLYYAALPHGIYFGSELSCLRAAGVPLEIDPDALRLYFQFAYIPDPYTAFRAVRKLPPGSWLTYDTTGAIRHDRYWRLPVPVEEADPALSEADMRARLRDKFDESVRLRMIADVPLGAFLSGGIDSSLVVASMALQSPDPVRTFSIGFDESEFSELGYASLVAKKYRTDHHEIVVRPDSVSLVHKLAQHFGEPFADSSAVPTFIVSEFAAQRVKVALSGDGGDELFAGYESFQAVERLAPCDAVPQALRRFVSAVADRLPYAAYGKNYLRMISRPSAIGRYLEYNYSPYYLRSKLLLPEWMLPADAGFVQRALADCFPPNGAGPLTQALYFEATASLTGDMLVKVDRMSMANSLEVRSPFLDHELAELSATIPHAWKIREGRGKRILIDAFADRLPAEILTRGKMGFSFPVADWLRGPLRPLLWDHLTGPRFLARGIVSPEFLRQFLDEHDSGRRNNSYWLWCLLMLELWFQNLEQPALNS